VRPSRKLLARIFVVVASVVTCLLLVHGSSARPPGFHVRVTVPFSPKPVLAPIPAGIAICRIRGIYVDFLRGGAISVGDGWERAAIAVPGSWMSVANVELRRREALEVWLERGESDSERALCDCALRGTPNASSAIDAARRVRIAGRFAADWSIVAIDLWRQVLVPSAPGEFELLIRVRGDVSCRARVIVCWNKTLFMGSREYLRRKYDQSAHIDAA
jgi:hypothetical protein